MILCVEPQPSLRAHSTRVRRSASTRRAGVVASTRADPAAWQAASLLADVPDEGRVVVEQLGGGCAPAVGGLAVLSQPRLRLRLRKSGR